MNAGPRHIVPREARKTGLGQSLVVPSCAQMQGTERHCGQDQWDEPSRPMMPTQKDVGHGPGL